MSQWKKLHVPPICERMIGFSVPRDREILVISYEGTHILRLSSEVAVETDFDFAEYDIYNPELGIAQYRNCEYNIIGLHGGNPILDSPNGEKLELNTYSEILSVTSQEATVFSMKYENFSGDWAIATLSPDGQFIILGCPYDFDFVVLQRV